MAHPLEQEPTNPLPFLTYATEDQNTYAKNAQLFPPDSASAKFVMDFASNPEFQRILKEQGINKGFIAIIDTGDHLLSPAVENAYGKDKDRVIYLTMGFFRKISQYVNEHSTSEEDAKLHAGHVLGVFCHEAFHPGKYAGHAEEYKADEHAARALARLGYNPEDYIQILEAIGDVFHDKASSSHPSATSRVYRLRNIVIPQIRKERHQQGKSIEFQREILPDQIEREFTELSPTIQEQRSWFSLSTNELDRRTRNAESIEEFWHYFVLYSTRKVVETGAHEALDISTGNLFWTKIFLLARGVYFYDLARNGYQRPHEQLNLDYPEFLLERTKFADDHIANGLVSHIERLCNRKNGWKQIGEYVTATEITEPREGILETQNYRKELANFLRGFMAYLLEKEGVKASDPKHRGLTPLRNWLRTYTQTDISQQLPSGRIGYMDWLDTYIDTFTQTQDPRAVDELINAQMSVIHTLLNSQAKKLDLPFYKTAVNEFEQLRQEWKTKKFSRTFLSDEIYPYALPLASKQIEDEINTLSAENRKEQGLAHHQLELETVSFEEDTLPFIHLSIGTCSAISHLTVLQEIRGFEQEFIFLLSQDPRLLGAGQMIFDGIAYGNWNPWKEFIDSLELDTLRTLQRALQERVKFPVGIKTHTDNFNLEQGFQNVLYLAFSEGLLFGNKGKIHYE